jgi:CHAT domain-containing protein/tetratricopeptide (TPR) repeat protein
MIASTLRLSTALSAICLLTLAIPAKTFVVPSSLTIQSTDQAAITGLIEKYFSAYAQKNLDAMTRLWSERSPDLPAARSRLRDSLAVNDSIQTKHLRLRKIDINADRARIVATLEVEATDTRTRAPSLTHGKRSRDMTLVREAGDWKIWSDVSLDEALAARLIDAQTDQERDALIAEDPELLTPSLVGAIYQTVRALGPGFASDRAWQLFQLMKSFAERIGDKPLLAVAYNGMATTMKERARYEESATYYEKSAQLREEAGLKTVLYIPLDNLAQMLVRVGDYSKALDCLQKALAIANETEDKEIAASQYRLITEIHIAQGNFDLALEYAKRSVELCEQAGLDGLSAARDTLATIYSLNGNFDIAIDIWKGALKDEEKRGHAASIAVYCFELGDTYFRQGNYGLAKEYHEKALARIDEVGDKFIQSELLVANAADRFHIGDYEAAIRYCDRAASITRQSGLLPLLADALTWLGKSNYAMGRLEEARRALEEAISVIETLRSRVAGYEQERQRFFEERVSPYHSLIELLVAGKRDNEALSYAERAKARVLLDVVLGHRSPVTRNMTAAESQEEQRNEDSITHLNNQIQYEIGRSNQNASRISELKSALEKARFDQQLFRDKLYAAHPELRLRRGETAPFDFQKTGELLSDSKTAILEYAVAGEHTYLFVITATEQRPAVKVFDLKISRRDLADRVRKLNRRIANNDIEYAGPATELYELLLGPAREQLAGKTRLIIIPDDVLWETPFQALRTTDGKFLVQATAVSYAPSLTVLREVSKSRKQRATTVLAMGNPKLAGQGYLRSKNLMGTNFEPLPEAERTVKELSQIYGDKAKVYVGAEAREDVFKAEAAKYSVLQLSTHGVINNASPMYSHLVLAQGNDPKEDGLLEAWEIMQLDLSADLAVLSACETARGRIGVGEGVIGLAWALSVAGCPTTVVSQWKVESSSTAELMLSFHRNLKTGMQKSEALRASALKVMADKRFGHPFYWAGFIVIGDGN